MKQIGQKGFTLIEILIVLVVIAILVTIVFIGIDPTQRFASARNAVRHNDVTALLNAVDQLTIDQGGNRPESITTEFQDMGISGANLETDLVPKYISYMLVDPSGGNQITTEYEIKIDNQNRITIRAAGAELDEEISVSR